MYYESKAEAMARYADKPYMQEQIAAIKGDVVYSEFMDGKKYKSNQQNRLFHGLLTCFWLSHCSSFASYDDMRRHYKRIAGLVKMKYENSLTEWCKECLYKAIRVLPLENAEKTSVYDLLKGRIEQEKSWSDVSKAKAADALTAILSDMDNAAVIGSAQGNKYEEILKGLGQ